MTYSLLEFKLRLPPDHEGNLALWLAVSGATVVVPLRR
jgi:hypothetical protein